MNAIVLETRLLTREKRLKKQKKFRELKQSQNEQLDFFSFLESREDKYSNTLELYDALPKYQIATKGIRRIKGRFLESRHASIVFQDDKYEIVVTPARVEDWRDGIEKDFLPGPREEILEDIIRMNSADHRRKGLYLDDEYSAVFTKNEIITLLKKFGHSFSKRQLNQSLDILNGANLKMTVKGEKKPIINSPFFPIYGQTDEENNNSPSFVVFNPLVTQEIKKGDFWVLNVEKAMSFKKTLARWFYKRLCQRYKQASFVNPYGEILYSTIQNDSGMKKYKDAYKGIAKVDEALKELIDKNIITTRKKDEIYSTKRKDKIVDAAFTLYPHPEFVSHMKYSNKRHTAAKEVAKKLEERKGIQAATKMLAGQRKRYKTKR